MEEKIRKAKELLEENEYVVIKLSDRMLKDSDECEAMMFNGEDKSCFGCSCSMCVVE